MSILILSAGKHGQLIRLLKEDFAKYDIQVITTSNTEYASGLYSGDFYYVVPDINSRKYLPTIEKIIQKHNVRGVFTLLDEETIILSSARDFFNDLGVKVFTSDLLVNHVCFDKYKFHKKMDEFVIPTVRTYNSKLAAEKNLEFPVVVKPNFGKGSVGISYLKSLEELKEYKFDPEKEIIQEFISGEEYDIDLFVDLKTGKISNLYMKRKLKTSLGGASVTETIFSEDIYNLVYKVVDSLQLRGPVNIDLIKQNDEYLVMEVNARFGAGYVHSHLAGVSFVENIVSNILDQEAKQLDLLTIKNQHRSKKLFIRDNYFQVVQR